MKMGEYEGNSIGFSTHGYNQIVVFSNEEALEKVVAANPNMTALMGTDDYTKQKYPGVFLAGITASSQRDISEGDRMATQKQSG